MCVGGYCPRGLLSEGDIVFGGECAGGYCHRGLLSWGVNVLGGGECPGGYCPNTQSFCILPLLNISDHSPCSINVNLKINPSLRFMVVSTLTVILINQKLFDVWSVSLKNIDTAAVIREFNTIANRFNTSIDRYNDIDTLTSDIENAIYDDCYKNKKGRNKFDKNKMQRMDNENLHLKSFNCYSIAEANQVLFSTLLNDNAPENDYLPYLQKAINYHNLAKYKEYTEYNIRINNKWNLCQKSNSRKLWRLIDWNDKGENQDNINIDPKVISSYFMDIF